MSAGTCAYFHSLILNNNHFFNNCFAFQLFGIISVLFIGINFQIKQIGNMEFFINFFWSSAKWLHHHRFHEFGRRASTFRSYIKRSLEISIAQIQSSVVILVAFVGLILSSLYIFTTYYKLILFAYLSNILIVCFLLPVFAIAISR